VSDLQRLGLGTAQWGMRYGISNRFGRPSDHEVDLMLGLAESEGVRLLDTAWSYGEAESVLGRRRATQRGYRIVTKTAVSQAGELDAGFIESEFERSLDRLGCSKVAALLVHHGESLLQPGGERSWRTLERIKERGRADRIGVSVYTPSELSTLLDCFPIETVQCPYSVFDQRISQSGLLDRMQDLKIEAHVRSVFLQGVLLLPNDHLPPHLRSIQVRHRELLEAFATAGVTPLQGALRFCLDDARISYVIVGSEAPAQLAEIISAARSPVLKRLDLGDFAVDDESITMPNRWPQTTTAR
jgi:aryl-alcohol dehydrogenase-like predicted oxidoreductase